MFASRLFAIFVLVVLAAGPAAAEESEVVVVLRSGGRLTGRIVFEDAQRLEIVLGDGMTMRLRKAVIARVEKVEAPERETPPPAEPAPETPPTPPAIPPEAAPPPGVETPPPASAPPAGDPLFFEREPRADWEIRYSGTPILGVAKLTRFLAYAYVEHSPLAVAPTDERFRRYVEEHGHGGSLSVWKLKFAGTRELRYGDEVKFVAEITSPVDEEMQLLRLVDGPSPVAERMVVLLVRRNGFVERWATPSTFEMNDFRQTDLRALETAEVTVRTYSGRFAPVASARLPPEQADFLAESRSLFGDSLRVRIERCLFRLDWFAADPADRPALDPDLLARGTLRPLALPGRPAADEDYVRRMWGSPEATAERLAELRAELRNSLARIGARPGEEWYVEEDRIGVLGKKGVGIETRRHRLTSELLADLLGAAPPPPEPAESATGR